MNVLITGGCGYIGSAIYDHLIQNMHVDTVDLEWFGNFNNSNNIKRDFADLSEEFLQKYDAIVHVAANSSVPLCKDIHDSFDNNVTKFLQMVRKLKNQKIIYASSSCVYVTSDEVPRVETDISPPTDGLTLSKTTIDNVMPLLDIEYYGIRFGSVNGWSPNMRTDLMINSMTLSALEDKKVKIFNGYAHRPIISTNDLSRLVSKIIFNREDKRGIYNAASFNTNVKEVGVRVANYMDVQLEDLGNNYTYDFTISSEKVCSAFDFKFEDSVESIVESILQKPRNSLWQKRDKK